MSREELELRYGCNPHQKPARVYSEHGRLPITVLNGRPGYINLLDALNGWQLVSELSQATGLPAATSFKHVSPAGAAIGQPMSAAMRQAHMVDDLQLSPLASAYARARGADRMSSFGDWVALSHKVDLSTAHLLRREVSDGIIAPDYEEEALKILRAKKGGSYCIIRIDRDYEPPSMERREVYGITFEQKRNDARLIPKIMQNIVTLNKVLPEAVRLDMTVALIALKYTQSNSVCLAYDGQLIGTGAGQQSRIHCTRLAAQKADVWFLRQQPAVLALPFRQDISRPARDNAIDLYLQEALPPEQEEQWRDLFHAAPPRLTFQEKREWLDQLTGVTLASDAFIPFRDNIDRAAQSGVKYVVQPGGSTRDESVIDACNQYGMVMVFTGTRLFHH